jgi:hypothetical protein
MIILVPLWLGLLIWLIWYPQRRQNRYEAAKAAAAQHELQMVAAMTEEMKEEYWRRKAAGGDDLTHVKAPSKCRHAAGGAGFRPAASRDCEG